MTSKESRYLRDNPLLMKEWDYTSEINKKLDVNRLTVGSGRKVDWICSVCGHRWSAHIYNRASNGVGCPKCGHNRGGRKRTTAIQGVDDLATTHPDLINEWVYPVLEKEKWRTPFNTRANSSVRIHWKCSKCGYEWETDLLTRTGQNTGCPSCSHKQAARKRATATQGVDDLATTHPDLTREWIHAIEESDNWRTPYNTRISSECKILWKCSYCGKEWITSVYSRNRIGKGCPECNKKLSTLKRAKSVKYEESLAYLYPELSQEWVKARDEKDTWHTPENTKPGANFSVVWRCRICGNEWSAVVYSRALAGNGCPECKKENDLQRRIEQAKAKTGVNDLAFLHPDIAKEWQHPIADIDNWRTPKNTKSGANCQVHWKCGVCGHEWNAAVCDRALQGTGCPKCANVKTSFPEQAVYYYIQKIDSSALNGYPLKLIDSSLKNSRYSLDIYIPNKKVAIEYDGWYFHSEKRKEKEKHKDQLLADVGIITYHIKDTLELVQTTHHGNTIEYHVDEHYTHLPEAIHLLICEIFGYTSSVDIDLSRDELDIRALFKTARIKNNLRDKFPQIAAEWDYEKNHGLCPEHVSYGSHDVFMWKCPLGHPSYPSSVKDRTHGRGCPVCANRIRLFSTAASPASAI